MQDAQRSESGSGSKTWEQNSIKSQITKSDNIKIVKMSIYSRSFVVDASAYQKYSYVNWSWSFVVRIYSPVRENIQFSTVIKRQIPFQLDWNDDDFVCVLTSFACSKNSVHVIPCQTLSSHFNSFHPFALGGWNHSIPICTLALGVITIYIHGI